MKQVGLILLTGFVMFVTACKKKETTPEPSKTELLAQHSWKLTNTQTDKGVWVSGNPVDSATIQGYLGSSVALSQLVNATITFKTDGTYTSVSETTGASSDGEWTFEENNTKIRINYGTDSYLLTIDEFTDVKLYLGLSIRDIVPDFLFDLPVQFRLVPA